MKETMKTIALSQTETDLLLALLEEATPNLFSEGIKTKLTLAEAIVATVSARRSDPETSKAGAKSVAMRAGSQKELLLREYKANQIFGLIDEEAGNASGLAYKNKCCYWKRCSELRQAGLIYPIGVTRASSVGEQQQVCSITPEGLVALGN